MFYFTDIYFALQYCLMTTDPCFYKIVHWHYIREIMIIPTYGMPINTSDSIIWDKIILQAHASETVDELLILILGNYMLLKIMT